MRARHYLDHASSSPIRPVARRAMMEALESDGADPSRIHAEGLVARAALEQARQSVALLLGARPREVVFTSGATESIAAAVWGAAGRGDHQVVPAVEHSAVREAAERAGAVTAVSVDGQGRVSPRDVLAAIRPDTGAVHVQWANHEVGTLQPVREVVQACRERGVLVHVDAAQAAGHLPVSFRELDADLLSVSGHKLGAPPGTGALLVRRGLRLAPLLVGGDQERARRAGMENVPAVVGLGAAADELCASSAPAEVDPSTGMKVTGQPTVQAAEEAAARRLTDRILRSVADVDGVVVYGDPVGRAPHIVCLGVLGVEPQAVLLALDRAGIAAHSGSACSSEALEPSPVLEAMGVDAHRSLRLSVGWSTSETDVDALLDALPVVLADLRRLGSRSDAAG